MPDVSNTNTNVAFSSFRTNISSLGRVRESQMRKSQEDSARRERADSTDGKFGEKEKMLREKMKKLRGFSDKLPKITKKAKARQQKVSLNFFLEHLICEQAVKGKQLLGVFLGTVSQ